MTAPARAAARLLEEKEALALAITEALYRDMPHLLAHHGEAGRAKCLQDMRYNLEHLAPAVELERPPMFAGYVRWLADLLAARGVGTDEVARSLELTAAVARERMDADEAEAVAAVVDAGLRELAAGGAR